MPTQTLTIPTDAGARDALLGRVRTLTTLRHPCVEPVLAGEVRDDGALLLRRGGGATDLPTVLAVRGRLTSREAAGVLVAVARGLAALHSAGLRQGSVRAQDVVLDPGGNALLRPRADADRDDAAGVGAGQVDVDPVDAEAADVHALATLVAELLGDRRDDDATALRAVLAPASAPDPHVRPEAGTLAAQADAAVPAEPVRLPEPAALAAASLGRRPTAPGTAPEAGRGAVSPARRRAVRRADGRRVGRTPSRSSRRTSAPRAGGVPRRVLGVVGAAAVVVVLAAVALQVHDAGDMPGPGAAPSGAARVGEVVESAGESAGGDVGRPETDPGRDASSPPDRSHGATQDPTHDRADPGAAAAELTRRRVALLAGEITDPAGLALVDVPGSPAHEADAALLEDAAQAGTRVRGAEARVEDARPAGTGDGGSDVEQDDGAAGGAADGAAEGATGRGADVEVRYAVTAHEQVAADGTVTAVPATDVRTATLRLAWTADGWRVAEVS
ncbi:hypothetical protein [Isoptericola sp. NPDC019482]|uniref:hypothetical protein n=1 Tax=Isoptericola sp. NPDC019482 TaxID=3154688 RepID=UPI00346BD3F2